MKYVFKKNLLRGLIKYRPNRFIMVVLVNGKEEKCHCPVTGKIGDIIFKDVPCLVSEAENKIRKTRFTVEAFSLDDGKNWIGINQTKSNEYVEFFLKENMFNGMIKAREIKREVKLGNSRIDFQINNQDYLEVKTPLNQLRLKKELNSKLTSFDRLIKHFQDISKIKGRKIFLLCYMYDATRFEVPESSRNEMKIVNAAKKAFSRGVETWQVNLKIDKNGVSLLDYFKLDLF